MGRMMNRLLQNAVMLGGVITAYQAAQTTKKENGKITVDKFLGNFRSQAAQNIRTVAGAAKPLAGKYFGLFTAKETKAPENETVRNIYETAKAVAPDAVEKVEEYVEDVKKNAPEYKAQAEKAIDDAAESAIEYLDLEDKPEEPKPAAPKKAAAPRKSAPRKSAPRKSAAARKADDASAEPKRKRGPRAKKTAETTETTEENK